MRSILSHCRDLPEQRVAAGEILLEEGGPAGVLYILIEGTIEILKGGFQIRTAQEAGSLFGEVSVLLGGVHTATVRAISECRVYRVESAAEFLRSHTEVTYAVATLLAQRLDSITGYLVDLKRQFEGSDEHFGMVDEVLEALVHQQDEELDLGSERDPDTTI
jgi:CRP-like cAMP-binding protein